MSSRERQCHKNQLKIQIIETNESFVVLVSIFVFFSCKFDYRKLKAIRNQTCISYEQKPLNWIEK